MTVYWICKAQKINASKETRENSLKVKLETWVPRPIPSIGCGKIDSQSLLLSDACY